MEALLGSGTVAVTIKAILALGVMGLAVGALLSLASRKFHVETDPKVEEVFEALPGANCGACGNPSCFNVAEQMVSGELGPEACIAGGRTVAESVAGILGQEAAEVVAAVSCRHCGGGVNAQRAFEYSGVMTCAAASKLGGGPVTCPAGCIGFGDCEHACPFDAISMDARGLPLIDLVKCTGCGICVTECPRGHFQMLALVPENAPVVVRCSSRDKGAAKRKYCTMSCIACKKCEKECPSSAIVVTENVARIDYALCTGCGTCVEVCPQNCIDISGREAGVIAQQTDGKGKDAPGFTADREAEPAAASE